MKKAIAFLVIAAFVVSAVAVGTVMAKKDGQAGKSDVAHLYLYEKDPTDWSCVDDGAWGKMKYNLAGPEFDFVFNGHGLENDTDYSLIYYADEIDRYVNWGGDNPGALIANGTSNSGGNIHLAGSINLDMDLPCCCEDYNGWYYDYSIDPDYYAHATGAKIWLVPSSDYNAGITKLIAWNPTKYLFETDLIQYDDTDETGCASCDTCT